MTLRDNSAGGKTLRIGHLSIFTDPIDKRFNFLYIKDHYHIGLYTGRYINLVWNYIALQQ